MSKKKQKGFLLVEMLIAMAVIAVLVSMSAINLQTLVTYQAQQAANKRVASMWQIIGEDSVCHVLYSQSPSLCAGLDALVPTANTAVVNGQFTYVYTVTANGWNYTATPATFAGGLASVSITNGGGVTGGVIGAGH